jgi:hypothetical protein
MQNFTTKSIKRINPRKSEIKRQIQCICSNKLRQVQLVCHWIITDPHVQYLNLLKSIDHEGQYEYKWSKTDIKFIKEFNDRRPAASLSLKKCDSHWVGLFNGQYMIMSVIKKILDSVELSDNDLSEEFSYRYDLI